MTRPIHAIVRAVPLLALLLMLPACGGPRNFTNENDRLRKENLELKRTVETLQRDLKRRSLQIEQMEQASTRPGLPAEVATVKASDLPKVTDIEFDRFTGSIDTNHDDIDDTLRVYLRTLDQRGRFLPAAGHAILQVVNIPSNGSPVEIARQVYPPKDFAEAYRTGIGGTHYTLELALPTNLGKGTHQFTVKVTFVDAATGQTFSNEQATKIRQ